MSFLVLACTDIRGEKLNVELPFSKPPASLTELCRILEYLFRGEENDVIERKAEMPTQSSEPFTVSRVQRYEENAQVWVELNDVRQLQLLDQLYVFRKHATRADISTQRDIPAPRRSPHFSSSCALGAAMTDTENETNFGGTKNTPSSPPLQFSLTRRLGDSDVQRNGNQKMNEDTIPSLPLHPTDSSERLKGDGAFVMGMKDGDSAISGVKERLSTEELSAVFAIGDSNHRGYLTLRDFQGILNVCGIQFSATTVEETFRCFAKEKLGKAVMGFQEFRNFSREFVQTVSVAYTRLCIRERQRVVEEEKQEKVSAVDLLQAEKKALEERLEAVQRKLVREKEKELRLRDELNELRKLDSVDCGEQEQRLIDKEVVIFQYRQKLHQEEDDYERLAAERRQRNTNMTLRQMFGNGGGYP